MNLRRGLRSGRCGGDNVTPLHRGRQSEEPKSRHPELRLLVAQGDESKRRSYVFHGTVRLRRLAWNSQCEEHGQAKKTGYYGRRVFSPMTSFRKRPGTSFTLRRQRRRVNGAWTGHPRELGWKLALRNGGMVRYVYFAADWICE